MSINIYELFSQRVKQQPNHPAFLGPNDGDIVTYAELDKRIVQASEKLLRAGHGPGSIIGLHCKSGGDYIVLTYGIWRIGGCVVPIPTELASVEKTQICQEIHLDGIIFSENDRNRLQECLSEEESTIFGDFTISKAKTNQTHPDGLFDLNPAFIRFTSGTTGNAKGVILSHQTIIDRINAANKFLQISNQDRVVWLLSMNYHFVVSIISYLNFGASIIFCSNHFGETIVETTSKYNGTLIYGSPIHFQLAAHEKSNHSMDHLRLAISTTTALNKEIADTFNRRFGKPLGQAYGIIEAGLPCINADVAGTQEISVGKILPDYQMRFHDKGLGEKKMEIQFKGPGFFDAYYKPFQLRKDICKDRWFKTGDLGYQNSNGYVFISGRNKDIISIGGMKFFPKDTEAVLMEHSNIQEAAVFSRIDRSKNETVHAMVKFCDHSLPPPTINELRKFCRTRLAAYKIPSHFHFVKELPRTGSGKLIRRQPANVEEKK